MPALPCSITDANWSNTHLKAFIQSIKLTAGEMCIEQNIFNLPREAKTLQRIFIQHVLISSHACQMGGSDWLFKEGGNAYQ